MTIRPTLAVVLALACALADGSATAQTLKIGYVDLQRALKVIDDRIFAITKAAVREHQIYGERKGRGVQLHRNGRRACTQHGW